jgi:adenylosuccinate lyase
MWLRIETLVLRHQLGHGAISADAKPLLARLESYAEADRVFGTEIAEIEAIEKRTKHDVAAFLEWVRSWSGPAARFLHYGLTSSDLVETAQGMRFRLMRETLMGELVSLQDELGRWSLNDQPILGRTHGQVAEAMTMRARAWGWMANAAAAAVQLLSACKRMEVAKISGPTGIYSHVPPIVETEVAIELELRPHSAGATQIGIRQPLAAWASSASQFIDALAKMAHDIRLMNLTGELRFHSTPGQVGSSSMAHKVNPIPAEQLAGMSAMGRGYAAMLQQMPLWLERDISNSSVERVAVPDLWHVTMHSIRLARQVLESAWLDESAITSEFTNAGADPIVFELTMEYISRGLSWKDARDMAKWDRCKADPSQGLAAMVNYPIPHPGGRNDRG